MIDNIRYFPFRYLEIYRKIKKATINYIRVQQLSARYFIRKRYYRQRQLTF